MMKSNKIYSVGLDLLKVALWWKRVHLFMQERRFEVSLVLVWYLGQWKGVK
jgi:hypothetical protein